MSILDVLKNATIFESIENYRLLDKSGADDVADLQEPYVTEFSRNEGFWLEIIKHPEKYWNKKLKFTSVIFSDWISRVPGLFATKKARLIGRRLREFKPRRINGYSVYRPNEKSMMVSGGAGTFKLPPDHHGYMLCTITSNQMTSHGIPVLISPEVWDDHSLSIGDEISNLEGRWQKMSHDWAKNFALTDLMPRGYLLVDKPEQLTKSGSNPGAIYDPYSIMEHEIDGVSKWDYVFCTVFSKDLNKEDGIIDFFEDYKKMDDNKGIYLLNPDIAMPIFETKFTTPADLYTPYGEAQMSLLKNRMTAQNAEHSLVDQMIKMVAENYSDAYSIRALSEKTGIPGNLINDDTPMKMSIQLVSLAIEKNKTMEIVQRMTIENEL